MSNSVFSWLLEKDNPGVRYLALRDLVGLSVKDPELVAAKKEAYTKGPIDEVLEQMAPDGYWVRPGPGYNPKYRSTVWSLILLSQLGASVDDDLRIKKACAYYLGHAFTNQNSLSSNGPPSGTVHCLQGNMCLALTLLGYNDPRLDLTYDWMACSVIGDGVKYYAYTCGPDFCCGVNAKKPCAWGAVKILLALGKLPKSKRTRSIEKAIKAGVDFLLSVDPFTAAYPTRTDSKPNRSWWKFGFPIYYVTDILQIVEAVAAVGHGRDKRLAKAIEFINEQADGQGRWSLEYDYAGKTWINFGKKHEQNKWVTYRVLKTLKSV